MVRYYGRARQRTGSVNTNQPGLKQAGCPSTVGKQGKIVRFLGRRVNCNLKTCGGPMSGLRCMYNVRDAIGQDKTWRDIQYSNNPAIKNYCHQVINKWNGTYCQWPQPKNRQMAGGVGNIWTPRRDNCQKTCSTGWQEKIMYHDQPEATLASGAFGANIYAPAEAPNVNADTFVGFWVPTWDTANDPLDSYQHLYGWGDGPGKPNHVVAAALIFSGITDITLALNATNSPELVTKYKAKGNTCWLTLGGGAATTLPTGGGTWTTAILHAMSSSAAWDPVLTAGYAGVSFDIEVCEGGITTADFNLAIMAANAAGLKTLVTTSHSAPIPDGGCASGIVAELIKNPEYAKYINYFSPQLYTSGCEIKVQRDATHNDNVNNPWSNWTAAGNKVVSSVPITCTLGTNSSGHGSSCLACATSTTPEPCPTGGEGVSLPGYDVANDAYDFGITPISSTGGGGMGLTPGAWGGIIYWDNCPATSGGGCPVGFPSGLCPGACAGGPARDGFSLVNMDCSPGACTCDKIMACCTGNPDVCLQCYNADKTWVAPYDDPGQGWVSPNTAEQQAAAKACGDTDGRWWFYDNMQYVCPKGMFTSPPYSNFAGSQPNPPYSSPPGTPQIELEKNTVCRFRYY